jgi:hypothetical protein
VKISGKEGLTFPWTRSFFKSTLPAGCQWLMPIIPASQGAEIRRNTVQSQLGQVVHETLSRKNPSGLEVWLKWLSTCFANTKPWVQTPVLQKKKKPIIKKGWWSGSWYSSSLSSSPSTTKKKKKLPLFTLQGNAIGGNWGIGKLSDLTKFTTGNEWHSWCLKPARQSS